nr:hypothetical protein DA06_07035 [Georgenia sp. SUBG003]
MDREVGAQRVDRRSQRLALPGAAAQGQLVVGAVEPDGLLAAQHLADDVDVLARPFERARIGLAVPASTTCGPEAPRPRTNRPPERWSRVMAAIAVAVGVRADICATAVPSRTRRVLAPHQASGVSASEPYASAVHTESSPRPSAAATASAAPAGGPADQ